MAFTTQRIEDLFKGIEESIKKEMSWRAKLNTQRRNGQMTKNMRSFVRTGRLQARVCCCCQNSFVPSQTTVGSTAPVSETQTAAMFEKSRGSQLQRFQLVSNAPRHDSHMQVFCKTVIDSHHAVAKLDRHFLCFIR